MGGGAGSRLRVAPLGSIFTLVALDPCPRGFLPCSHGRPGWLRLGGVRRVAPFHLGSGGQHLNGWHSSGVGLGIQEGPAPDLLQRACGLEGDVCLGSWLVRAGGGMSGWCILIQPLCLGGWDRGSWKIPQWSFIVSWFSPSQGKKPPLPMGSPFLPLFMPSPTMKHGLLFCSPSSPSGPICHQANF